MSEIEQVKERQALIDECSIDNWKNHDPIEFELVETAAFLIPDKEQYASIPNTYWGNQKNAYLLASQFRSLAKFNKAYGLITWSKPDFESTNWNQEEYIMQSLYPYQVNTR